MIPVAIGDTQGTLQARKTWFAMYKRPETFLRLHTGVAPEVNLRECIRCTPLPSSNKAAHSGFETQRRHHQKFETGVSVARKMDMCPTNFFFKKKTNTLPIWWLRSLEERSTKEKLIAVLLGRKSCTPFRWPGGFYILHILNLFFNSLHSKKSQCLKNISSFFFHCVI